ncbi:MAG: serine hydrolase [Bryobacterales bacterium]|nr:serine hydrolase [Bryobacterales bacterium]
MGAQLHRSLNGRVVRIDAAGTARLDGTPMTPETFMVWDSATKPVTATCIGQLWEPSDLQF